MKKYLSYILFLFLLFPLVLSHAYAHSGEVHGVSVSSTDTYMTGSITVEKDGAIVKNATVIAFDQGRDVNDLGVASFDHVHTGTNKVTVIAINSDGTKSQYVQDVDFDTPNIKVLLAGKGDTYNASQFLSEPVVSSSSSGNSVVLIVILAIVVLLLALMAGLFFFGKKLPLIKNITSKFRDKKFRLALFTSLFLFILVLIFLQIFFVRDVNQFFQIKDTTKAAVSLPVPTNVRVSPDDRVATLEWNGLKDLGNPTGVSGYLIRWGKQSIGYTDTKITTYRAIQMQPLENGTQYIAEVYSIDDAGNVSAPSPQVTFTGNSARVDALRTQMNGFFDDFNLAAGDFDQTKWNLATTACVGKGYGSNFINTQSHAHNIIGDRNCDRGQVVSRPRALLDLSQGTRTIAFDFDGDPDAGIEEWYLDLFAYDPAFPVRDLQEDVSIGDIGPKFGIKDPGTILRISQGNPSDNGVHVQYFGPDGIKYQFDNQPNSGVCVDLRFCSPKRISNVPNVRRHWKILLSKTSIVITIDDIKVADVNLVNTTLPSGLPFNQAYMHWNHTSYNTQKHNDSTVLLHWDNFGFDAPAGTTKTVVTHNYTDGVIGTQYSLDQNLSYVIPPSTITSPVNKVIKIPDQIMNNGGVAPIEARLKYTMQSALSGTSFRSFNGSDPAEYVLINGKKYTVPVLKSKIAGFDFVATLASGYATYTQQININPADLVTGDNNIAIAINNSGVTNLHLEIDYPKNPNLKYTQPINTYPNYASEIQSDHTVAIKPGAAIANINGVNLPSGSIHTPVDTQYTKQVTWVGNVIGNLATTVHINAIPYMAGMGVNNGLAHYDVYMDRKIVYSKDTFQDNTILGRVHAPVVDDVVTISSAGLCNGEHELFVRAYDSDNTVSFPDYYHTGFIDTFDYKLDYIPVDFQSSNTGATACNGRSHIPTALPPLYPTGITPTPVPTTTVPLTTLITASPVTTLPITTTVPKTTTVAPTTSPVTTVPITTTVAVSTTANPLCACGTNNLCTNSCTFAGVATGSTFSCLREDDKISQTISAANKNSYCKRNARTTGDADGNGIVDSLDYFYYQQFVNGVKVADIINPDFNGDSVVSLADRNIVIGTLNALP